MSSSSIIAIVVVGGFILIIVDLIQNAIDRKAEKKEIDKFYIEKLPKVQWILDVVKSCKTTGQLYSAFKWGHEIISRFKPGANSYDYEPTCRFHSMLDEVVDKRETELFEEKYG